MIVCLIQEQGYPRFHVLHVILKRCLHFGKNFRKSGWVLLKELFDQIETEDWLDQLVDLVPLLMPDDAFFLLLLLLELFLVVATVFSLLLIDVASRIDGAVTIMHE